MPRHMSFALTTEQVKRRIKTVTRRGGWRDLKPGTLLWAVNKSQGLKKGEHPVKLSLIRCVSNTPEPLNAITPEDVEREGFAGWSVEQFVEMYCAHNGGAPDQMVNRIEFEYVEDQE